MNTKNWIKNTEDFSDSQEKKIMFELVNTIFDSVDTEKVIANGIKLEGDILYIKNQVFILSNFKRIKIVGIGKVSGSAVIALEKILLDKINAGVVIDIKEIKSEIIESFIGTHPKPSIKNVKATEKILELAKDSNEKDLILIIVSGGGSALLCSSESEYFQGQKLYDNFLKSGGNIKELNLIRKHLSTLKGGGLAKVFYPATIAGLIFCDISGGHYEEVASGPTYKDTTTINDAEKIIEKYKLGNFILTETPKEDIYFEKVVNIPMVSNVVALEALSQKAKSLELTSKTISYQIFESAEITIENFLKNSKEANLIIGGGEIKIEVKSDKGSGGRCLYLAMSILPHLKENQIFAGIASDGMDNCDSAGAIVDINTYKKAKELGLDLNKYLEDSNAYEFFEKTGDMIFTGPTGINIADIMILLSFEN